MSFPLKGRSIALAEGRQLEELVLLLQAEGATILRCPMVSILDAPEAAPVLAWIDALIAGRLELLILMTGEAVRRLVGFAERAGKKDALIAGLNRVPTLTRGPKPGQGLKELGLKPTRLAGTPTTEGVIAALRDESLRGKNVGLTLYGGANPELENFLAEAGAKVHPVLSYVYAPSSDDQRVEDLVRQLAAGQVSGLVFTSSPQVDRLYEIVKKHGLEELLVRGLAQTRVAAVGPVVAENLRGRGAPVHVCPEQGWVMKNLVRHIVRDLEQK
jgi:uroporphyrinogen-III synthase